MSKIPRQQISQIVSIQEARDLTRNYRTRYRNEIKGHLFKKEDIEAILNQRGCIGIRAYYGIDDVGKKSLVLIGVKETLSNYEDILGVAVDRGAPCPTQCDSSSPLMT